jgi:spore coat assembly protein SafA
MTLSPMRFKTYVWPHNPRTYEIDYKRSVVSHKVPFGVYTLQSLGRSNRILKGEGEFCGQGAYDEFKKLACLFYDDTPGVLVHPLWQTTSAYFVDLSLRQEPTQDYVSYSFEFWECFDYYQTGARLLTGQSTSAASSSGAKTAADADKKWYTVVRGDCMWNIANRCGMTLQKLVALNPQIKNPNLIYPGDKIRVA